MIRTFALAVLLAACTPAAPPGTARGLLSVGAPCETLEGHGAIAGDGVDDRAAINAAFASAAAGPGCLLAGPGRFEATHDPEFGATHIQSLAVRAPLVFRGAGVGVTTIAMMGSGTRTGKASPSDWWLIGVYAPLQISDMSIDGAARFATGEQTHLVNLAPGARDVLIERVHLDLPSVGPSSGGDCIRLIGAPTAWVERVTIRDVVGDHCDRAFVGLQRYVRDLTLQRVESKHTETALDLEPTGSAPACVPIIHRLRVADSVLARGDYATGDNTVSIAGLGCALASDIDIRTTAIRDGGISVLDAGDVTLTGLAIRNHLSGYAGAPLLARKRIVRLRVIGGSIERVAGSPPGQVVKITGQSGANPTDATLLGVSIVQQVEGAPVYAESLGSLVIIGSDIDYFGPPTTARAVKNRGIDAPAGAPVVADTPVTGHLGGVAEMSGLTDGGQPVVIRSALN
jgi:hypothetical protein